MAREQIKLEDIGIQTLRLRKAITGALLLEITGPDGREKAILLNKKMEEALKNMEGVKVARPEKMAELRLKDVLDDTDTEEIRKVIVSVGGCRPNEIKFGTTRKSARGLGTL